MCARQNGDAAAGSIAPWNFRKSSMWQFGAAVISNAGGRTRFLGIAALNARGFLKCIHGQTVDRRKTSKEKAQCFVRIGGSVLTNSPKASLTKISISQSILIACASKRR